VKQGWEIKRLGEVCEVIAGQSPEGKYYNSERNGTPFYQGKKEFTNKYIAAPTTWTTEVTKEAIKGDILMSVRAPVGPVNFSTQSICIGRGLAAIRVTPIIDSAFIFYFLVKNESEIEGNSGAVFNSINKSQIENILVPLPPLSDQKRIVAILDESFAAIAKAKANAEKNLANARELFESYLNGVEAPKRALGDFVDIKTGKLDANAAVERGKYPFFTCSRDVFSINTYAFDCEAVLLAGNNAIGDFNVKHYIGKFNAYQRTYVITVNEKNQVLCRYLYFQILKSLKMFKEKSIGAGTKFLKIGIIQNIQISIPSLDEQTGIVAKLDALSAETKKLESIYQRRLADLDELKKSLLERAFKGELTEGSL
jgi:type I restriction enzyme S subunit